MAFLVKFHWTPIVCQSEIACPVKDGRSLYFVINNKPSLFQCVNLLDEGKGLLCIIHTKKNEVPACCTPQRGRVPESIERKDKAFLRNNQKFNRKSA